MKPVAVAVLAFLIAGCSSPPTEARPGEKMPDYASRTLDGTAVALSELEGRVVLLNVWATWCVPCREEIPALQSLHEVHQERGLELVGVSIDGPGEEDRIRRFLEEYGATYTIWHDADDTIGEQLNLFGVPATFLIDRKGLLQWQKLGPVDAGDPQLTAALERALEN